METSTFDHYSVYLRPYTLEKLKQFSKEINMKPSELIREILEDFVSQE